MTKLDEVQIEQIRIMKEKKVKKEDIAKLFNVSISTIDYQTNKKNREYQIEKSRKYYNSLSEEKKKERTKKRRGYIKVYMKKRYNEDPIFRKKHQERASKYWKDKYHHDEEFKIKEKKRSIEKYGRKKK